jgi:hypothetical protein
MCRLKYTLQTMKASVVQIVRTVSINLYSQTEFPLGFEEKFDVLTYTYGNNLYNVINE